MKKILYFLFALCLAGCSAQVNVDQIVEQTLAAIPTQTPLPTYTAAPTEKPAATLKPKLTATPEESQDQVREDVISQISELMLWAKDVEEINMVRAENGVLEIEARTKWASEDSQPDASYQMIRY